MNRLALRKAWSAFMIGLAALSAGIAAATLVVVVLYVVSKGAPALSVSFFTHLPRPVGVPGGGVANALLGSVVVIALASVVAIPIGALAGIYLALFGRGRLADAVRFLSDVLTGVPSIAIGVFAYALVVLPTHHFSGTSASVALGIIMLPIVVRTTEEAVRLVPHTIREGALALGMPTWKAVLLVTLPVARPGITTGALLSIARVAGESAPLLFTAFGSQFWSNPISSPTAALPLVIFQYAISPYHEWQQVAWGGALLLIFVIFALNLAARLVLGAKFAR